MKNTDSNSRKLTQKVLIYLKKKKKVIKNINFSRKKIENPYLKSNFVFVFLGIGN